MVVLLAGGIIEVGEVHMAYLFPPDVEKLVEAQMAGGGYASEDDVLREALKVLEQIVHFRPNPNARAINSLDDLRHEVQRGLDELERGEGLDADQVFDEQL
jgi:Arc/MetJ-type ribon-helix-helix transcriptional regulator